MSTLAQPQLAAVPHWLRHVAWFAFVSAVAFLVPFVGVSVLGLQHDRPSKNRQPDPRRPRWPDRALSRSYG